MSRLPVPNSDDNVWGNILNDFLRVAHNEDGSLRDAAMIASAEQTANKGVADGYASLDGNGLIPVSQLPDIARPHTLPFSAAGTLSTQTGTNRLYNDSGKSWQIQSVRATVGTAPSGSSIVIDINLSGTTIFTTQANRPTVADGAVTSGKISTMDITTVPAGSYLTVDIDQVGSSAPGANLTVQVEVV